MDQSRTAAVVSSLYLGYSSMSEGNTKWVVAVSLATFLATLTG